MSFYKNLTISEGGRGGLHILNWEKVEIYQKIHAVRAEFEVLSNMFLAEVRKVVLLYQGDFENILLHWK